MRTHVTALGSTTEEPWIVSQHTLAEFVRLREAAQQFELLKEDIRAALATGAYVEPGPWQATLTKRYGRRLTVGYLADVLGLSPDELQRLRCDVPPTQYVRLEVTPSRKVDTR